METLIFKSYQEPVNSIALVFIEFLISNEVIIRLLAEKQAIPIIFQQSTGLRIRLMVDSKAPGLRNEPLMGI